MAPSGPSRLLAVGLLAAAVLLISFAYSADEATAQGGANNTTDWTFSIHGVPGKEQWSPAALTIPAGSKVEMVYNSSKAGLLHDLQVCTMAVAPASCKTGATGFLAGTKTGINPDSPPERTGTFVLPTDGAHYICSIHPTTMVGTLSVGEFTAGGGAEEPAITHAGVHYLAYWVGVISFAVLFVVYGASYFLFKHGETPETTDQKDRPGFEDKRVIAGLPEYVWIIIGLTVVALGVTIFFNIMLSGL